MLIQTLPADTGFDDPSEADSSRHWHAAPQLKFERLLRETQVPIGLLCNSRQLRLVCAPRGESSGHATFNVDEMVQVAGRPMFAALHMLLSADRMFTLGEKQRLPAILTNSRKYQNTVSTKLAEQVLAALYELMRGFQAANDVRRGELLRQVLEENPNHVYSGLLTVLMRLVFVLYAEDRDLMSSDPVYSNNYSVTGLFERLRSDKGRFPDTMDQRFGAWSQLLTLFRLVFEGGQHATFKLPARKGYLFDPDRYPFLEGVTREPTGASPGSDDATETGASALRLAGHSIPRISDAIIYNVLSNLLILDGERLSYRTLDVEQIGSVYETMMGFDLQVAQGQSIAIKPVKSHGAPATINLDELLETPGKDRAKWIKDGTDQKITGEALKALKAAESIDALLEALDKKIHKTVTPRVVSAGAIVLQPSDERRRSGSHYTPRSLTKPIVETTLEPILKQLVRHPDATREPQGASPGSGAHATRGQPGLAPGQPGLAPVGSREEQELKPVEPRPVDKQLRKRLTKGEAAGEKTLLDAKGRKTKVQVIKSERDEEAARLAQEKGSPHPRQILNLKVCDIAMGSGAFLVETCRQLGDELVAAWHAHECVPTDIPPDEDEILYARRLIAQRCLYGVDKNPMAVDLSKLALWLATLAKDHAFTFLDHALRHGDSLVGLTAEQIAGFTWELKPGKKSRSQGTTFKSNIQSRLERATAERRKILDAREDAPYRDQEQRMAVADEALSLPRLVGDACISAFFSEDKKKARDEACDQLFGKLTDWLQSGDIMKRKPIGDAALSLRIGEHPLPPFHWEIEFPEVFSRENGGFDAFVGNPPFMGGSKLSSAMGKEYLSWLSTRFEDSKGKSDLVAYFFRHCFDAIREQGTTGLVTTNTIRQSDTRYTSLRWIRTHGGTIYCAVTRKRWPGTAAVVVSVVHFSKQQQHASVILDERTVEVITAYLLHFGPDENPCCLAANKPLVHSGVNANGKGFILTPEEREEFVTANPANDNRILPYLGAEEMNNSSTASHSRYAIHMEGLSESEVKEWPELYEHLSSTVRVQRRNSGEKRLREKWWLYSRPARELYESVGNRSRLLASGRHGAHICFVFQSPEMVFSDALTLFVFECDFGFAVLQSRTHEIWARFFSSSLKDDCRYIPEDCFETFPFPDEEGNVARVGREYYAERQRLMLSNKEGLTDTYNRFHAPDEMSDEIRKLRELHDDMDRAVLRAYKWNDLAEKASCEFLLDYEEEEDDDPTAKKSKKKKPWRYRWPDDFRDEVLARLLELNEQRAKEEKLAGKTAEAKAKSDAAKPRGRKSTKKQEPKLFDHD